MNRELEDLEPVSEGYTNRVYIDNEGDISKRYRSYSVGAIFHFFRELILSRELSFASDRISNEKKIRDRISPDIKFAKILEEDGKWLKFEYIKGESVNSALKNEKVDPEKLGSQVGELMNIFDQKGVYLYDWVLDDIIITDDGLAMIDLEFGGFSQSMVKKKFDQMSIFAQAAALDKTTYREFTEGLESEVTMTPAVKASGLVSSFLFNLLYVWDDGRPFNVIRNIIQDLRRSNR